MNKKIILPVIMATIIGVSILGATPAHAQTSDSSPFQSLIQKIVEKFGLKQADVESVFEEHRNQKQLEMQQRYQTRLEEAVKNGTITEEQKQLILKKQEELISSREKNRTELETWAKENNIDLSLFFGFRHGKGFGHRFMMK